MLATTIGCTFAEVDFLLSEMNDYNVDFNTAWENATQDIPRQHIEINHLIDGVYSEVCNRYNIDYEKVEFDLNSVASSFSIDGNTMQFESDVIKYRLEYLRGEIRAERISQGEISELQNLASHIDPSDIELLEWAGVPEKR